MSLTRDLALNTGVQVAGKVVSTGLGVALVALLTRQLGQEGFGMYSTANAFLQMFALLLDLGLNVTLIALLGEHADDKAYEKRCLSALFTLRIVLAVIILGFAAPLVALAFPYPWELKLAIFALTASFIFPSLNQVVIGAQQRHLRMHMAAVSENVGRLIALLGLLFAPTLGWGLVPLMWVISVAGFVNFFINFLFARRYAPLGWNWDPEFWLMALKRSWPVGVSIAFGLAYFKADTLILSLVRSQAEVGIYGAAYRVLEVLITVPFMYAGVLLPLLSHSYVKRDKDRFQKLVSGSLDVMVIMALPMVVGTWLLGPQLMELVGGPEFVDSGYILRILVLAVAVIYLNTVFSHIVVALDAQRKMLPIYAVVGLGTVLLYLLLIPTYGMWAAAWLTVISEIIVGIGSLFVSKRYVPIVFKPKATLAAIGACLAMAAVVVVSGALPVLARILLGAGTYIACVILFGGVSKAVLRDVLKLRSETPTELGPKNW
ncbi:flippase [Patescibacteria group bacterium]|jgi:O-antigen/teichoic acid export membrane protein|nr:flippase [Patescibacteria group bacterium]